MNRKRALLIGTLCILAVVTVVVVKGLFAEKRSHEQILLDSVQKTIFQDTYEQNLVVDVTSLTFVDPVEDERLNFYLSLLEDVRLSLNIKALESKEFQMVVTAMIKNVPIVDATIYADEERLGFEMPLLYDQPFYATWDEIEAETGFSRDEWQEVKQNLLQKKYEDIEDFDATGLLEVLGSFIGSGLSDEVVKERIYSQQDKIQVTNFNGSWSAEQLFDLLIDAISTMIPQEYETVGKELSAEKDTALDVADFDVDSHFVVYKDQILSHESQINGTLQGIINHPIQFELLVSSALESTDDVNITGMDFTKGVDVLALSDEELEVLFEDIEETLVNNMGNDVYLENIDIESILGVR